MASQDPQRHSNLNASSTTSSLTKATRHDQEGDKKEPKHEPNDSLTHSDSVLGDDDDDGEENPDADIDPHLANGHGHGGYGEHHEKQRDEDGRSEDVIIVDWDGPDDPCNPRKYAPKVLSCIEFFSDSSLLVGRIR